MALQTWHSHDWWWLWALEHRLSNAQVLTTTTNHATASLLQSHPFLAGAAEGLRNWEGTEDIGPKTDVGHSNRGTAPRTTEGRAGERCGRGSPLPQRVRGVTLGNFEIVNAKSCIFRHFQPWPQWSTPTVRRDARITSKYWGLMRRTGA